MSDFLVDTNILVYIYDPRDRDKQVRADSVVDRLIQSEQAVVSVQCLTEFFRSVRWRLPEPLNPNEALLRVERISLACRVLNLTSQTVLTGCQASNQFQMSIWDALIWAAAKLNEVPYVLTEDGQHGQTIEGVTYLDPFHPDFDTSLLDTTA